MGWPTPQEYNEAIQNPRLAFRDPELQGGQCESTPLGLPRPITGNFASVYRLQCGRRDWAVRCFWREFSDMQHRYAAISAHLAAQRLSYTVGFEYQPQGMKVGSSWYPIVKMEWVEGELLNDFIRSHLNDAAALQALSERWVRMVRELEAAGCAHGDLQHGNVLVVNGELTLVDYDGMYVPALRGKGSHELGQQHYQHPARTGADFGPELDRFSSWVIFLSLRALGGDDSLWDATGAGDEHLLFRRADFESPDAASIWAVLAAHPDSEVQALANRFNAALRGPLMAVPSLASALVPASGARTSVSTSARARLVRRWWRAVAPSNEGGSELDRAPASGSLPDWMTDHLMPQLRAVDVEANEGARLARLVSVAALGPAALVMVVVDLTGVPLTLDIIAITTGWLLTCAAAVIGSYRRHPAVRPLLPPVRRELQAQRALVAADRAARRTVQRRLRAERRRVRISEEGDRQARGLESRLEERRERRAGELAAALQTLEARLAEHEERDRNGEAVALEEQRRRRIAWALRRTSLLRASIPGVGWGLKARLWCMGIWSAADVSQERIAALRDLDHTALHAIVAWRVETEVQARRALPKDGPAGARQGARARHDAAAEREALEMEAERDVAAAQAACERRLERVRRRTARRLERSQALCAALDERASELAGRRDGLERALRAAQDEMALAGNVSFRSYLQSVYVPRLRRGHP